VLRPLPRRAPSTAAGLNGHPSHRSLVATDATLRDADEDEILGTLTSCQTWRCQRSRRCCANASPSTLRSLIGRPTTAGHLAEWIAARIVGIAMEPFAEGTGISCDDPDLLADLRTACRALGYLN
jgi:hypothetical protein